jgi:hypothetical protein
MAGTSHPRRRLAVALVATAVLVLGAMAPATAARPSTALTLTGGDRWFTHDVGWFPVVRGPAEVQIGGRTITGDLAATIQPDDYTMPGPGECEGAMTFVHVDGDRPAGDLFLSSVGEVCGHHLQPPTSVVVHSYTGPLYVEEAGTRRLVGQTGFLDIRLADDGRAHVFAST